MGMKNQRETSDLLLITNKAIAGALESKEISVIARHRDITVFDIGDAYIFDLQ